MLVIVAAVAMALTAGLSLAGEPVVLKILMTSGCAPQYAAINPIFEAENPGVKIQMDTVGYMDRYQKIVTTMPARPQDLDIVAFGNDEVAGFMKGGWLLDITDKVPKSTIDAMLPGAAEVLSYKKRLYGIPWSLAAKGFFYNFDMMKKAGFDDPPRSWPELIAQTQKMQKLGICKYGITLGVKEGSWIDFITFAGLFGLDEIIDGNGKALFDNDKGVKAVQYMYDLIYKYKVASPSSVSAADHEVMSTFLSGQNPFLLNWPYVAAMMDDPKQSSVIGKSAIGLIPGLGNKRSYSYIGTMGIGCSSGSRNKDLAVKYILWTARPEIHKKMILVSKEVPILKELIYDRDIQNASPNMLIMSKQFAYSVNPPKFPWFVEDQTIIVDYLGKALSKAMPVKKAVHQMAVEINKLAAKYAK